MIRHAEAWKGMDDSEGIEVVVIFSHSDNNKIAVDTNHLENGSEDRVRIDRDDIKDLEKKDIDNLILLGCNAGLDNNTIQSKVTKYDYSIGETFLMGKNKDSIGRVIASDGSVHHNYVNDGQLESYTTKSKRYADVVELLGEIDGCSN